ncbi:MAG TPA: hypothetical protein VJO12_03415 [Stellaceae bacterium]|nr:hypothetical protein [Stellaceae bacterium]
MPTYRCYFLNKADVIVAVEEIECAGEEEVRETARRLLRERLGYAVEVWDRARKILRLLREPV